MRVDNKGKFIFLVLIFSFVNSFVTANCNDKSQEQFEKEIHELTKKFRNDYQSQENAIRKDKIEEKYYQDLRKLLCLNEVFSFTGRVWSLDFMNDGSNYILKIGNSNPDVPYPYFYHYRFSKNDKLLDKLENLSRGDDVKFKFSFIDTFSPDSQHYRGTPFPFQPSSETGNLIYSLYINLHEIEVVKSN